MAVQKAKASQDTAYHAGSGGRRKMAGRRGCRGQRRRRRRRRRRRQGRTRVHLGLHVGCLRPLQLRVVVDAPAILRAGAVLCAPPRHVGVPLRQDHRIRGVCRSWHLLSLGHWVRGVVIAEVSLPPRRPGWAGGGAGLEVDPHHAGRGGRLGSERQADACRQRAALGFGGGQRQVQRGHRVVAHRQRALRVLKAVRCARAAGGQHCGREQPEQQ